MAERTHTPREKLVFTFSQSDSPGDVTDSCEWECSKCQLINPLACGTCQRCGEAQPSNDCDNCSGNGTCDECVKTPVPLAKTPLLIAGRCSHCKTYNDPILKQCPVCNTPHTQQEPVWKCPGCGDYNLNTVRTCDNCQYLRSTSLSVAP